MISTPRSVQFVRIAAEAEALMLKRQARRVGQRIACGVVALVFGVAVLVGLHLLLAMALLNFVHMQPFYVVLVVLGVDVLCAAVFGAMAASGAPDKIAVEAKLVRDRSLSEAKASVSEILTDPVSLLLGRNRTLRLLAGTLVQRWYARRR